MIISDKYKCIFIRIPKTASSSIEKLFKKLDPDCICSTDPSFVNFPYGHHSASQLKKMVKDDKWNSYFKFTLFAILILGLNHNILIICNIVIINILLCIFY